MHLDQVPSGWHVLFTVPTNERPWKYEGHRTVTVSPAVAESRWSVVVSIWCVAHDGDAHSSYEGHVGCTVVTHFQTSGSSEIVSAAQRLRVQLPSSAPQPDAPQLRRTVPLCLSPHGADTVSPLVTPSKCKSASTLPQSMQTPSCSALPVCSTQWRGRHCKASPLYTPPSQTLLRSGSGLPTRSSPAAVSCLATRPTCCWGSVTAERPGISHVRNCQSGVA